MIDLNPEPEYWYTFHQGDKLRLVRVKRHTFFGRCQHAETMKVEYLSPDDVDRRMVRPAQCAQSAGSGLRMSTFVNSLVQTFAFCQGHGGHLRAEMALACWLEENKATLITARRARRLTRHRRRSSARQFMDITFDD